MMEQAIIYAATIGITSLLLALRRLLFVRRPMRGGYHLYLMRYAHIPRRFPPDDLDRQPPIVNQFDQLFSANLKEVHWFKIGNEFRAQQSVLKHLSRDFIQIHSAPKPAALRSVILHAQSAKAQRVVKGVIKLKGVIKPRDFYL